MMAKQFKPALEYQDLAILIEQNREINNILEQVAKQHNIRAIKTDIVGDTAYVDFGFNVDVEKLPQTCGKFKLTYREYSSQTRPHRFRFK